MRIAARSRTVIGPGRLARSAGLLLALIAALLFGTAASVAAQPRLTDQITDQAGVLDASGRAQLQSALDDLQSRGNVQLWILLVPTTGGPTAQSYAQQTYASNGLGGNDMLLVVAVNDHRYGWTGATSGGLPDSTVDSLLSSNLDSHFRAGDYAGGLTSFAQAFTSRILAGQSAPTPAEPAQKPTAPPPFETIPPAIPGNTGSGGGDGGTVLLVFGLLIVAIGIVVVVVGLAARYRSWRLARFTAEERDRRTGELARQANSLLLQTDDAIRDAQQELGFAEAEFSADDVAPFRKAIGDAQEQLKQAFTIRQQLDDAIPEDPPTKERLYGQIVSLCQAGLGTIAEQHKAIQALRDLEQTAPQALAALPEAIAALQAREPAVKAAVETLGGYAPSAWAAVRGNPEEADKRGAAAEAELERGKQALAATPPDKLGAVHAVRSAQQAIAQANALLDAVEQQAAAVRQAQDALEAELTNAERDLDAADRTLANGPADAQSADDLAKAKAALSSARAAASAQPADPIAALKAAQSARSTADRVLEGAREAEQARLRAKAAFDSARSSAATSISQAQAYIANRRNGVGREARTRVAEAERHLATADGLVATSVAQATAEARTADRMADEAYELARRDFDDFDFRPPRRGGGGGGGADLGSFLGGVILGGILSGSGGHRGGWGGGWGGTPWGSGGGWGGGGGGGFGGFGGHGGGGGWSGGGGGGGGGHGGGGGW